MTIPPVLAVRADGGPATGVGHLARCLALVQAWVDRRGDAFLISHAPPDHWAARFRAEGCAVVEPSGDWPHADWWVTDGYELASSDRDGQGARTLLIDDDDAAHTRGDGADLVVDQNLGADPDRYPLASSVLAGPRYALLRRELTTQRTSSHRSPALARRVLIILGGAPSPEVSALGHAVATHPLVKGFDVRMLDGTDDVASEMLRADLAVAAAGTVSWELCMFGVPAVLIAVADNQEGPADRLTELGAAMRAAPQLAAIVASLLALARDHPRRDEMSRIGRSLVDGLGARRVTARLHGELLSLRDVEMTDADLLYRWSNDPDTRRASFSSAPIAWAEHLAWMAERLASPTARAFLATDHTGATVGLVRFDERSLGVVEAGLTVAPDRRGEGLAAGLIDAGCRRLVTDRGPLLIEARIRKGNTSSLRAFVDADFVEAGGEEPDVLRYARG